jgi:predicted TIM-barrel fold metal-dependent hydrolase
MRWIRRAFPGHPVSEDVSADKIVSDLREAGVTHFFNLAYPLREHETESINEFNLDFCGRTPGAIPFASLHPETPDKAGVGERALGAGFVGFKFHPFVQGFDPWDRRMDPLYELLQEAGRPVLFHTGFELFYKKPMPVSELEKMLNRFPRLPVVLVHMAFPELEWAFKMLEKRPDLYLDATNVLACLRPAYRPMLAAVPDGDRFSEVLVDGLERHRGRVMYGSDHPAGMGGLGDIYRDLEMLPVDAETRRAMRCGAARAFIERFSPGFFF